MAAKTEINFLYTKVEVAKFFCNTAKEIGVWIDAGCPVAGKKGVRYELDIREVIAWRLGVMSGDVEAEEGTVSYQKEKALLAKAQREAKELELNLLRGKVADVTELYKVWEDIATAVKTKLLSIPTKVAPLLDGARNTAKRKDIVEKAITDALNELAREAVGTTSETVLAEDDTPAKTKNKRVGRPRKKT